jgi:crotonobetainyl-CoA:carnitine CoA-transferase CaiB-like acyl-CoA transferase
MIVDVPVAGRPIPMLGLPIKLSGDQGQAHAPAPALGEHNDAVLRDLLGLEPGAIAMLRDRGVI